MTACVFLAQAHAGVWPCPPARAPAGARPLPLVQLAQADRNMASGSNFGKYFLILSSFSFSFSISVFCECCGRKNEFMVVAVAVSLVFQRKHLLLACPDLHRKHLRPAGLVFQCDRLRLAGSRPRDPTFGKYFLVLFSFSFSFSSSVFCKCCGRQNKVMVVVVVVALVLQLEHLRSTCPVLRLLHLRPTGLVFQCDHLRPTGSRPRGPFCGKYFLVLFSFFSF